MHDETPQTRWKLAVVEDLITRSDKRVCVMKIPTDSGVTNRQIVKLYQIEVIE